MPKVYAKRGQIYKYTNSSGTYTGYCLIVSANERCADKMISVIQLTDIRDNDFRIILEIVLPDGEIYGVNCGMVTYLRRSLLNEYICTIDADMMERVNDRLKIELGLISEEQLDYNQRYSELINKIAGWNKPAKKHATRKDEL